MMTKNSIIDRWRKKKETGSKESMQTMTPDPWRKRKTEAYSKESMRSYHWSLRTWQGKVLRAIVLGGAPPTFKEIQESTLLQDKQVDKAVQDLIEYKTIYRIENEDKSQVKYQVFNDLQSSYSAFYNLSKMAEPTSEILKSVLPSWVEQWKEVKNLDFSENDEQCFLERRHLDDFSKELISHASSEVLVANPFIQDCDLSNTLQKAKKNGTEVQIITRQPEDKYPDYLEKKKRYLQKLESRGIEIFYNQKVHAKLIVVDRMVAIVSSMNFYAESSAGVSWEAGLVTWNRAVVNSVIASFHQCINDETIENQQN